MRVTENATFLKFHLFLCLLLFWSVNESNGKNASIFFFLDTNFFFSIIEFNGVSMTKLNGGNKDCFNSLPL